jgi:5-methylcytosine-specific restriction endonuclease McrA
VTKRFGSWKKAKIAVSQRTGTLHSPEPRRRARRRTTIPMGRRYQVFQRDMFTCSVCKSSGVAIEVDHIIPISRVGTDRIENLRTLCVPCNRGKSNRI